MRSAVDTVGSQADFIHGVALEIQSDAGRGAGHGGIVEHHYTRVVLTDAEFILGADHSEAFNSADLRLLELELLALEIDQFRTDSCQKHLLTGSHIGSAADYLQRLTAAHVKLGDVQMVGIGVRHALQHVGDNYALKPSGNLFYGFYMLDLKAG